jgi:hypothetical protein
MTVMQAVIATQGWQIAISPLGMLLLLLLTCPHSCCQHQEALQAKQEAVRQQLLNRRPGTTEQQAAITALQELATGLTDLCGELWMKIQLSSFLAAARTLALHHTHHTFKGLSQPPQLLYLPSAAAALAPGGSSSSSDGGGGPAGASSSSGLGAVSPIKSSSQHTMYLAMPNLQLPPYMLLLASGAWCGNTPAGSSSCAAAAAAAADLPASAAALGPTLCMSFPRRRVMGESRDCLLLVLCDAQGLVGPVLKRIRVPVSCYASVAAVAAAASVAVGAGSAAAAAGQLRKRKRDYAGDAGTPQDNQQQQAQPEQQQQPQQQQQQQRQPRVRGQLLQPEEHITELTAAVRWCQARLTYERVKLELEALQLDFQEVQLLQLPAVRLQGTTAELQQQQQQVWQQPGIKLLGVPGVHLFQQLQRKPGCSPSSLGLQEVWFSTGPEYGQWRMHVRGSFYHQATAAAAAAAAAVNGLDLQQQQQQQQQQGPPDFYEYDLRAGHSVRSAVLQLLRMLHMQVFLNRLETMAWGAQALQVVQVGSSIGLLVQAVQLQSDSKQAAAATVGGAADVGMEEADGALPAAKRAKQNKQQQQDGLDNGSATAAAAGVGMANGVASHGEEVLHSSHLPSSNGKLLADGPMHLSGSRAGADAGHSSSSSKESPYGLLFHWEGTGLVRLSSYSCWAAQLVCGAPLQPLAAGSSSSRQRLRFSVQWEPQFEFATHSSSSSSGSCNGSSSTTTTWVDVRPAAGSRGGGGAYDRAVPAADVLAMTCSMQCSAQHVPADVLNELCDMANCDAVDVLLDTLGIVAWPLAGVAAALASPAAAAAAAVAAEKSLFCRAVSSCALSGPCHVRYRLDWLPQQQQVPAAAGSTAAGAAGATAAADVLLLEMLFACRGNVVVLIRQHDPAALHKPSPQQQQQLAALPKAAAAAILGFVKQFRKKQGPRVPLVPAVSNGRYSVLLPPQGSRSAEAVAGFILEAQHLEFVLQEFLQYWQQHVVNKQQQQGTAAAVKVEVAATPPQQQQQQDQQPQAQQQRSLAVPGQQPGQASGAMQQQQQQLLPGQVAVKSEQQQQQQQPPLQNSHMLQQPMQHAAAGHVVSGR